MLNNICCIEDNIDNYCNISLHYMLAHNLHIALSDNNILLNNLAYKYLDAGMIVDLYNLCQQDILVEACLYLWALSDNNTLLNNFEHNYLAVDMITHLYKECQQDIPRLKTIQTTNSKNYPI
jgi:hypothetical protein